MHWRICIQAFRARCSWEADHFEPTSLHLCYLAAQCVCAQAIICALGPPATCVWQSLTWRRPCACAQTRFVGMMQYDGDLKLPARFLVPPPAISDVSGELLAKMNVSTFACSETQKFGHVRAT